MTKEQLTEAYLINQEIETLKEFRKLFNNQYATSIVAREYTDVGREIKKELMLGKYPKLEEVIDITLGNMIFDLEKQFEEL